jgi:hypothetical protein
MKGKKVWDFISKEDIPEERRCVKCKWIFKVKCNGIFCERLAACGSSMLHLELIQNCKLWSNNYFLSLDPCEPLSYVV